LKAAVVVVFDVVVCVVVALVVVVFEVVVLDVVVVFLVVVFDVVVVLCWVVFFFAFGFFAELNDVVDDVLEIVVETAALVALVFELEPHADSVSAATAASTTPDEAPFRIAVILLSGPPG
jgi:hypothetical protein